MIYVYLISLSLSLLLFSFSLSFNYYNLLKCTAGALLTCSRAVDKGGGDVVDRAEEPARPLPVVHPEAEDRVDAARVGQPERRLYRVGTSSVDGGIIHIKP